MESWEITTEDRDCYLLSAIVIGTGIYIYIYIYILSNLVIDTGRSTWCSCYASCLATLLIFSVGVVVLHVNVHSRKFLILSCLIRDR